MDARTMEALVRRYSGGERSPDLLAALDAAAWEEFHDPWERRPADLRHLRRPSGGSGRSLAEQIAACLEARHWNYSPDGSGGFRCRPVLPGVAQQDLLLRLFGDRRQERRDRLVFYLRCSGWRLPADAAARLAIHQVCDQWEASHPSLHARPHLDAASRARSAGVALFAHLDPEPGNPIPAIGAFLDGCLAQADRFLRRVSRQLNS